ncbi:MAG: AzlC family ABC transporter permease [Gammaproteobacteria bacterium]|nr:AzlC family ABC transporter permease [Gammaproteobacteria bacterium]
MARLRFCGLERTRLTHRSQEQPEELTFAPSREFMSGARDTLPLIVGMVPFGFIFGALAITAGLSLWATMGLSLFVFAGSAQFVAAGLVGQGAGVTLIVVTTFIVNVRHALYAASLGPFVRKLSHRWLIPLGFWLTDETYAVVIQRYEKADASENKHWYYLGSALCMYFTWNICTLIGAFTGNAFEGIKDLGLEFAMVATFIGIVVPLLKTLPMLVCALVSAVVSLAFHELPHQLGLILGSLVGIAAGVTAARLSKSGKAL